LLGAFREGEKKMGPKGTHFQRSVGRGKGVKKKYFRDATSV